MNQHGRLAVCRTSLNHMNRLSVYLINRHCGDSILNIVDGGKQLPVQTTSIVSACAHKSDNLENIITLLVLF